MDFLNSFQSLITAPVGNTLDNREDDILNVRTALDRFGAMPEEAEREKDVPFITKALDDGIRNFQRRKGLFEDGVMKPGGETERTILGLPRQTEESVGESGNRIGFGSNISGTFEPKPKRKPKSKPPGQPLFSSPLTDPVAEEEELDENGFVTMSGGLRVNKDEIFKRIALKQNGVDVPLTRRVGEDDVRLVQSGQLGTVVPERKPELERKPLRARMNVKIPQYGFDPVFNHFRENLKTVEGGISDRSFEADPGGLTNKGFSQALLNDLREQNPEWNLPSRTTDLTDKQITDLFRHEFYERPKIGKLSKVKSLQETEPRLVEHVFDAGIPSGPSDAGRWLQEALDETIGTDLRTKAKNGQKFYDGNIGPKTRMAVKKAVQNKKIRTVHELFAQKRLQHMRELPNYEHNKNGWEARVRSFLE